MLFFYYGFDKVQFLRSSNINLAEKSEKIFLSKELIFIIKLLDPCSRDVKVFIYNIGTPTTLPQGFPSYPNAATYFSCSIDTIRSNLKDEKIYKKMYLVL